MKKHEIAVFIENEEMLKEKIRGIIETNDCLVRYKHGDEHCILPEKYDELAQDLTNLITSLLTLPQLEEILKTEKG